LKPETQFSIEPSEFHLATGLFSQLWHKHFKLSSRFSSRFESTDFLSIDVDILWCLNPQPNTSPFDGQNGHSD